MQQIEDHILRARELKKNLKSQPVQNKMQIIVFTCQENNAHEENMRISGNIQKPFSKIFYEWYIQDEGNHVVNGRGCKENILHTVSTTQNLRHVITMGHFGVLN